ncbi:hypothetical protein [Paenibacillus sp. UASWS1643]|uniref:hypothetical protein n=1 Tax=Paenibacillus sp. UASWS1643 TaxID=2580422 RepID=UPI001682CEF7|nr:hypothetical protein [Paenibacillus sp. UASWS1643]
MTKKRKQPSKEIEKKISSEAIVGTSDIAACIGKTTQWVAQLTRDGVLSQISRGKYLLGPTIKAYINHVTGVAEEGKISYNDEKAQHEQIKKEIAMLELEEKRKNLHSTKDVQEAWGDLLVNFRGMLMVLPPSIAAKLTYMTDEKEIRTMLEQRITSALVALSKYDPLNGSGGDAE